MKTDYTIRLEQVSYPEFAIRGFKGFENARFSEISEDGILDFAEAVLYARERNMVLGSARDAAAYTPHSLAQGAGRTIITRTIGACFLDGEESYAAFDDDPRPEKNILLSGIKAITESEQEDYHWTLSKNDERVRALLKRAEKTGRIVQNPFNHMKAYKSPGTKFERTPREQARDNPLVQAILGSQAEAFARSLCELITLNSIAASISTNRRTISAGKEQVQIVGVTIKIPHGQVGEERAALYADCPLGCQTDNGYAFGIRNPPAFRGYR